MVLDRSLELNAIRFYKKRYRNPRIEKTEAKERNAFFFIKKEMWNSAPTRHTPVTPRQSGPSYSTLLLQTDAVQRAVWHTGCITGTRTI